MFENVALSTDKRSMVGCGMRNDESVERVSGPGEARGRLGDSVEGCGRYPKIDGGAEMPYDVPCVLDATNLLKVNQLECWDGGAAQPPGHTPPRRPRFASAGTCCPKVSSRRNARSISLPKAVPSSRIGFFAAKASFGFRLTVLVSVETCCRTYGSSMPIINAQALIHRSAISRSYPGAPWSLRFYKVAHPAERAPARRSLDAVDASGSGRYLQA